MPASRNLLRPCLLIALFLFSSARTSPAQEDVYDWRSWGAVVDTLIAPAEGQRLPLSAPFVFAHSESVYVDGQPLSHEFYEINYQRGFLRITRPLAEGARIVVRYTRLPFLLNSVYSIREIEFADTPERTPLTRPAARKAPPVPVPAGNLVFGGVKSISLSVGTNKSASLDQTLRATVEGDLTPTIKVKALLSDNNLPIQPEGNTEELEYLDKVFVEFTGPRATATLGDFAFQNSFSSYSAFRRELKGATAEVAFGGTKAGAAAGSAKGVFRTVSFRGTEQLQGPYELLSQGRLLGEVVIAGTEKVYFDGEQLRRGQNRDYTIDYDRGTIVFTPRRLVTADTEISVDFEVTQEKYDRSSVFGQVDAGSLPGGFRLQAMGARETDDADRPKSVAIDDSDVPILQAAGDDGNRAIAGGVTAAAPGKGSYRFVPADSISGTPGHYVFDDSTGTFNVQFAEVGVGNGGYVLDGITAAGLPIYRFAGTSAGNFVVGKRLPLPEEHRLVAVRLSRTDRGRLGIDLQYNVSEFDANTRSTRDDSDNVGDAGELNVTVNSIPVGLGTLALSGGVSTVEERFRSLEKTRTSFFYRDWNLEGVPIAGREVIGKFASSLSHGEAVRFDYELGNLHRDNFDGTKQEIRLSLSSMKDRLLTARVFSTDVTGETQDRSRTHQTVSGSYGFWRVVPSFIYASEEFSVESPALPDTGIAYDRYLVRVARRRAGRFMYAFEAEQRDTEQRADTTSGWVDTRSDRTWRASFIARGIRVIQAELQYAHRTEDGRLFGGRQTSDLARLKGALRIDRIGFRSNFDYEISQSQFRSQEKNVVFVGAGQGDFNELGEPVGKGRGDYTVVFLPTLNTIPTRSVDLTLRISIRPKAAKSGGGMLHWIRSNVSLEQSLSVKEETTFKDAFKVYLLFPSALQRNESTLSGVVSLRQDWSLLNGYRNVSLTFRYQRDDEEDNRFGPAREDRFFEQEIVRVDRAVSRLFTANLEFGREIRRRGGTGLPSGTGSTFDVVGWKAAGGWGIRLSGGSTVDGEIEIKRQIDDVSGARETALALKPRFVWRPSRTFNVFGRYEITRFSSKPETGARPFFFSSTGTGQRWSLTPNVKLSKSISLVATYEGRSEDTFSGKRIVENDFRIETRAFF